MEELKGKIKTLSYLEVQEVMEAIQDWYGEAYPDWDVVYMAVPKEPKSRKTALKRMWILLKKDLEWNKKKYREKQKMA